MTAETVHAPRNFLETAWGVVDLPSVRCDHPQFADRSQRLVAWPVRDVPAVGVGECRVVQFSMAEAPAVDLYRDQIPLRLSGRHRVPVAEYGFTVVDVEGIAVLRVSLDHPSGSSNLTS